MKMSANSAQALEVLISTMRTALTRGLGGSTPKQGWNLAALNTAPELALGRDNEALVEWISIF
jgi:hypothetical protein